MDSPTDNPLNFDGDVPWANISDLGPKILDAPLRTVASDAEGAARQRLVETGELLFSFKLSVGSVSMAGAPMHTNEAIARFSDSPSLLSRYAFYALPVMVTRNCNFNIYGAPLLNRELIRQAPVALPSIHQQGMIADFLDRETAQIDAMIEAQEQVVARLTERRSSTITALVTGHALGLPLTASGNPLLGEVPEGWEVGRFGRHTRINGGQVDPGIEPWNEMILVAPNHVESGTGRLLALETAAEQGADSGKYLVRKGQIVYSKIRPSLNKVTIAPQDVLCSADMYGITCLGDGDHRYFANFMLATPFHQYATMVSDRVKMPKINREELSAAPWLVPPVAEQTRIADLVDATTRGLDTAISETRALSALLHGRREALITAAVTGRIDPTTGIERIDPTTEEEAS